MATATAPAPYTEEILDRTQDGGEWHYRYRWAVGEASGEDRASGPIEPVARSVLLDRWAGLVKGADGEASELLERLDSVLADLAEGVVRRDIGGPDKVVRDGEIIGVDMVMDNDGLEDVIRDWILERAAKVARP